VPMPSFLADLRERVGHDELLLPTVCALVFDPAGRLLLGRRADTGTWALIGGLVEPGEQVADAVVREVHEETSLFVRPERITGVYTDADIRYPNGDRVCYVVTVFHCVPVSGTPRVNDDESLAVAYFPIDDLPPLVPAHRQRIQDAMAGRAEAVFIPPRMPSSTAEEHLLGGSHPVTSPA
jgi:8-oxo-dGTP pyrophosphatase MutT (NUDIX family)